MGESCPNCHRNDNQINGLAVLEIVSALEAKKRMHCSVTLDALEMQFPDRQLPPRIRKAVLDGYNDLARSLYLTLGLQTAE
jgi:hypothetical protein